MNEIKKQDEWIIVIPQLPDKKKWKINLTPSQKEVIKLMREGWELGASGSTSNHWLQKDGVGRGGETKKINNSIAFVLREKNLIFCPEYHFPSSTYLLTELGKTIEL